MLCPIIIVQAGEGGAACRRYLERDGFEEGKEFLIFRTHESVECGDHIKLDARQLLVTGAPEDMDLNKVEEFVTKMKKCNPRLVAMSFSSFETLPGPFDAHISKCQEHAHLRLSTAMRRFLNGATVEV